MSRSKVSIRFTSLTNLWAFRLAINANIFEMNLAQMTITCECSKEDIKLAIEKYNGTVVNQMKEQA